MGNRRDLDTLRTAIRGHGLRATPSRVAVLSLLRAQAAPLSHGDVADRLADEAWDRATIYRNLTDLAEAGLLRRSDLGDHVWRFEVVDGTHAAGQHPHFVCTACGSVACLPDLELSVRRGKAPRALKQKQIEVQVRGRCDACM